MNIPFYKTYTQAESIENIASLVNNPQLITEKNYTKECTAFFEKQYPGYKALMVSSCTRALDLIAMALDLELGDEVIMPSFNYVGAANAFANTGASLVFADVEPKTMNADVQDIAANISSKTKAVLVMNYGGMGCELDTIQTLCKEKDIVLIEDNAQGIGATVYEGKLGSFGDFSCISFDSLKNISCGEGGVLLFKPAYEESVRRVFHNGTNRLLFERGEIDAYEWVSIGSKFAISEYNAAVLFPLLVNSDAIIAERREKWQLLYDALDKLEHIQPFLPIEMNKSNHNAHIFYLKFKTNRQRDLTLKFLLNEGVECSFHYTPLHSSVYGLDNSLTMRNDVYTSKESKCLLRLPIFNALDSQDVRHIAQSLNQPTVHENM